MFFLPIWMGSFSNFDIFHVSCAYSNLMICKLTSADFKKLSISTVVIYKMEKIYMVNKINNGERRKQGVIQT